MAEAHARAAVEASDALAWGPHTEIAGRVLETAGAPLEALDRTLDEAAREQVGRCVSGRATWREAAEVLGRQDLPVGSDLVVAWRLCARRDRLEDHGLGPDGWGIVVANRSRMRGRLRAVLRQRPELLWAALTELDALDARTSAALSRHAWAWAWREARRGFSFDLGRLTSSACVIPEVELPRPLGPGDHEAVLGFLVHALGRGCWEELERWIAGEGRSLGARFYRVLAGVPEDLADPRVGERARRYTRLREHLDDGGLEAYAPALQRLGARAALLPSGKALGPALRALLEEHGVEPPTRGARAYQAALAAFLRG